MDRGSWTPAAGWGSWSPWMATTGHWMLSPSASSLPLLLSAAASGHTPWYTSARTLPASLWPDASTARAACAPILERATLLKLSLDDAAFLFESGIEPEQALERAASSGARYTVLTDGARGAWFKSPGGDDIDTFVPSFAVDAIEPTGAGDSFNAAIISCLIAQDWRALRRDNVRFAAAAGALATTRRGAIEALPVRNEIEVFLASR